VYEEVKSGGKNRIDKHWFTQELKYNWETEITGTGSRSKVF